MKLSKKILCEAKRCLELRVKEVVALVNKPGLEKECKRCFPEFEYTGSQQEPLQALLTAAIYDSLDHLCR